MPREYHKYIKRAKEHGVTGAKTISAGSIIVAEWVRMKCRYGCGGYGSSHCCPPNSPEPETTSKLIACYSKAIMIHCGHYREPTKIAVALEREIFLDGHYKALALGSGPCYLCKSCDLENCAHPETARPSMEACGIDVFATARANGFPISVVKTRGEKGNYYGLVLIE